MQLVWGIKIEEYLPTMSPSFIFSQPAPCPGYSRVSRIPGWPCLEFWGFKIKSESWSLFTFVCYLAPGDKLFFTCYQEALVFSGWWITLSLPLCFSQHWSQQEPLYLSALVFPDTCCMPPPRVLSSIRTLCHFTATSDNLIVTSSLVSCFSVADTPPWPVTGSSLPAGQQLTQLQSLLSVSVCSGHLLHQ